MNKLNNNTGRLQRKRRIRAKVTGTSSCPRLAVYKSLKAVYAQVIDDAQGKTLVSATTGEMKKAANTIEGAKEVGKLIAKKCAEAKITAVVFDRAGYKYHGKVKALAEGAREGGLKF